MFVSFINVFSRVRKVTRESTRFNNKNSEPEAEVRLLSFKTKLKFFKEACCQKHTVILEMSEWERILFVKRQLQTTKWKNKKYIVRLLEEFQARFDHLNEWKPCFAFLVNPFNLNVVGDGCPVRQQFVTNLSAVTMKLTESQGLDLKNFSQCHSTVEFWRQVPQSKIPRI